MEISAYEYQFSSLNIHLQFTDNIFIMHWSQEAKFFK